MIRRAVETDIGEVMRIIEEVIREMRAEGSDQWSEAYPSAADFLADIRRRELFVHETEGRLAGFLCVNGREHEAYRSLVWSAERRATVLHRMAVDATMRGRGVASGLMRFAEEVAFEEGTGYLRSDTYSLNGPMNALFRKEGYRFVGEVHFPGRPRVFNCYDKILRPAP